MKFCLRSRCQSTYLSKADEIKVEWRDRESIPDLAEKYPSAAIILQFTPSQIGTDIPDMSEILTYQSYCKDFICCVHDTALIPDLVDRGVKCYYGFPVDSFWELNGLKAMGVCYVRLGPGLFFQLDKVVSLGVPVRAVPNVAYIDTTHHANGLCGTWIRPEDTDLYSNYITCYEFEDADVRKEQALYRIYSADGWPGNLNQLITNLNYDITNYLMLPSFSERRINCGNRCQYDSNSCHFCPLAASLADVDTAQKLVDATKHS